MCLSRAKKAHEHKIVMYLKEKNCTYFIKMKESSSKLNDDPVLRRIMDLLQEQNRTDKELIDFLGLSNGVFTKWKYAGVKSYIKHIREIAEFLGTTTGYLLHGVDDDLNQDYLTEDEAKVLQLYRNIDEEGRVYAMEVLRRFSINSPGEHKPV